MYEYFYLTYNINTKDCVEQTNTIEKIYVIWYKFYMMWIYIHKKEGKNMDKRKLVTKIVSGIIIGLLVLGLIASIVYPLVIYLR